MNIGVQEEFKLRVEKPFILYYNNSVKIKKERIDFMYWLLLILLIMLFPVLLPLVLLIGFICLVVKCFTK